uniref:Ig-like domain-containing protein n=1 Tax=uncultured Methanobacterium sp. TaxID=176306 RepID=UPI002AA8D58A
MNDVPVAAADSTSTDENVPVIINVLGNDSDVDGDSLVVSGVGVAGHGTVTNNGNSVTYTPNAGFHGLDSFSYTVSDGHDGSVVGVVYVVVNESVHVNHVPVAAADSVNGYEDTRVVINVLGNDSDSDGDSLSVSAIGSAGHGSVVLNGDGTVTYTPDANWFGSDSFTYVISDGHGGTSTAMVYLVINPLNDAPVAVTDTVSTDENTPIVIHVLNNDFSIDGGSFTVTGVGAATHGTVTTNGDGTVTYTPDASYHGFDSFTYTIEDDNYDSATGTVFITVNPVNDPLAADDTANTLEDTRVTIPVLANDDDLDGDSLTVLGVGVAGHGSVVLNGDSTVTYTPDANWFGSDSFMYTISDGYGGTATATVNVMVNSVNDVPVAATDSTSTDVDVPVVISVLGNDSDVDGDSLSVSAVGSAVHGTVTNNGDGTVTYTPVTDYYGWDSFPYTVSDGHGGTATSTVLVMVGVINNNPVAATDNTNTDEDITVTIPVLAND